MLVECSQSQDVEAGDGTTSIVVLAGALLGACSGLLGKGIHPAMITSSFYKATEQSFTFSSFVALYFVSTSSWHRFCLSAPKTDMDNNVIVSDYAAILLVLSCSRRSTCGLLTLPCIRDSTCHLLSLPRSRRSIFGLWRDGAQCC